MPDRIEATFYIKEPPEIEFIDGMFLITQRVGGYKFERVMAPRVFTQAVQVGNEALAKYRIEHLGGEVVPLKAVK